MLSYVLPDLPPFLSLVLCLGDGRKGSRGIRLCCCCTHSRWETVIDRLCIPIFFFLSATFSIFGLLFGAGGTSRELFIALAVEEKHNSIFCAFCCTLILVLLKFFRHIWKREEREILNFLVSCIKGEP